MPVIVKRRGSPPLASPLSVIIRAGEKVRDYVIIQNNIVAIAARVGASERVRLNNRNRSLATSLAVESLGEPGKPVSPGMTSEWINAFNERCNCTRTAYSMSSHVARRREFPLLIRLITGRTDVGVLRGVYVAFARRALEIRSS